MVARAVAQTALVAACVVAAGLVAFPLLAGGTADPCAAAANVFMRRVGPFPDGGPFSPIMSLMEREVRASAEAKMRQLGLVGCYRGLARALALKVEPPRQEFEGSPFLQNLGRR